jgi:hypothetical protein
LPDCVLLQAARPASKAAQAACLSHGAQRRGMAATNPQKRNENVEKDMDTESVSKANWAKDYQNDTSAMVQ